MGSWRLGWKLLERGGDKEPPGQQPGQDVAVDSEHKC